MKPFFTPAKITSESLQQFRQVTDPLADNVIAKIIQSGQEKQINQVLMTLMRNSSFQKGMFASFGHELSTLLDGYIETSAQLPAWADSKLITKGEHLFELYGPDIFMLLNVSSLPMCYCCGNGAQVLFDTGRLLVYNSNVDPLARRLMETAQMIFNVMCPGGLAQNGSGIITIQKVRLIHASIRYFLKHGQAGAWDSIHFGEPINQEDLAGTLMSFGPVILAGLKKLGAKLTDDDTNAWMHCWNITGYMLGIDESLLPDTYNQGFELASKILSHQASSSDAGKALTKSCIQFMQSIIPGNAFDEVPEYLMSYFLQDFTQSSGKDLNVCISLKPNSDLKDQLVLRLSNFIAKELSNLKTHDFVRSITESFNKLLLQGIIYHFNGGKGVQFFIPPSLQANWGLIDVWKDFVSTPSLLGNRVTWQKKSEQLQ
ncbi:MAG TPA: DUF2236 domain-containing protein [Cytophagales bacterium]|nr:DUF2236 domain-containing protein [Cytophagales bacterium]